MIKKATKKKIEEVINKLGYELIDIEERYGQPYVHVRDNSGYMFLSYFQRIKNGQKTLIGRSNPYSLNNIKLWMKLNNKNFELVSKEYINNSDKMEWYCFKCNEIFYMKWGHISQGHGCAVCHGKQTPYKKSFGYNCQELLNEWSDKNIINPFEVPLSSNKKVLWKCFICDYEWKIGITTRVNQKTNCPACSGRAVTDENRLSILKPDLVKEWSDRNNNFSHDFSYGSSKKAWWICNKCKHEWKAVISSRSKGCGCPSCAGNILTDNNRLSIIRPELLEEWSDKNIISPHDIAYSSSKYKILWECKVCSYEWEASPNHRARGQGCPACAGRVATDKNNLLLFRPNLIEEWDFGRNEVEPNNVTYKSGKKVWWICSKCNNNWEAIIYNRSNGQGCPTCHSFKGEDKIRRVLFRFEFDFDEQVSFDGCKYKRLLKFDFYIPNINFCIEYNGKQHYESIKWFGGEEQFKLQQIRDKIKRDFCKENNINLLEIPYWEFDNMEQILSKYLKPTLDKIVI